MRVPGRISCILILCTASWFFTSCKKQVAQEATPAATITSSAGAANACKPVVWGVLVRYEGQYPSEFWRTLMQKWYGPDGKVEYLKADFYHSNEDYQYLHTQIRWARLIYNNNQVALDEGSGDANSSRMRVTLDARQRPAVSYYFHDGGPRGPMGNYLKDTTYYYFTGDRLDSTKSISAGYYGSPSSTFSYKYHYDEYGNLLKISSGEFITTVWTYDYTQPVTDMLAMRGNGNASGIPSKLMQYMDLLRFPIHHKIIGFNEYQLQDNGLVYAYSQSSYNKRTYYTGWECGGASTSAGLANRQSNGPRSYEEFQRMFPAPQQ